MSIDARAQCKVSFHDYELFQVRQLCSTLDKIRLIRLSEQIQSRILLTGTVPVNSKVYQYVIGKIKEANDDKI